MFRWAKLAAVCLGLLALLGAFAQQAPAALEITTIELARCAVDLPCAASVEARGGTVPYQWHMLGGALPAGLTLDPATGKVEGTPSEIGDWEALIEVFDSGRPPQKASRALKGKTVAALTLDWVAPPVLQATTNVGSLKVANNSKEPLDLTVIVVAVNEVGKAFALGYQHLELASERTLEEVPFISQLPAGRYTVRADAIAESAARRKIFRAARQAGPFAVPVQ